jgi:hypothetical protein
LSYIKRAKPHFNIFKLLEEGTGREGGREGRKEGRKEGGREGGTT